MPDEPQVPALTELRVMALLNAVQLQRDSALNQVVRLTADLAVAADELAKERQQTSALRAQMQALRPGGEE